jgi:hypothetical protein
MSSKKIIVIDKTTGLAYDPVIAIGEIMVCRPLASKLCPVPLEDIKRTNLKGVIA